MKQWLDCLTDVLNIDVSKSGILDDELNRIGEKLGIELPPIIKLIYSYIGNDERLMSAKLEKIAFLPSNKLYIDENNLVYKAQGKKYLSGYDLEKHRLNYYAKDYGWYWSEDTMSFWQQACVDIYCYAINHMQTVVYSRLKGFTSLFPSREAEERYMGFLTRIDNFDYYDHTLFYNKEHRAIAWFRGGQFNQDILIGCDDRSFIDKFVETFGLTKANYKIVDGEMAKKSKK